MNVKDYCDYIQRTVPKARRSTLRRRKWRDRRVSEYEARQALTPRTQQR